MSKRPVKAGGRSARQASAVGAVDETLAKLQPKLRMVRKGDLTVCAMRAERMGAIRIASPGKLPEAAKEGSRAIVRGRWISARKAPRTARPAKLATPRGDVMVSVFVENLSPRGDERKASPDTLPALGRTRLRRGNLRTVEIPLSKLGELLRQPGVRYVSLADTLKAPRPAARGPAVDKPPAGRTVALPPSVVLKKRPVVGIVDVGGFDFTHPDFIDAKGRSRFLYIWDQGAGLASPAPHPSPAERKRKTPDSRFDYGAEFTRVHLDSALRDATKFGAPATELEPQTQMSPGSHATHVASIAAGNRGVCPDCDIVGVLLSLPDADNDPRLSFYDSTRLIDAIEYLLHIAKEVDQPIAINISLGTNGHAHDGSPPVCRWMEHVTSRPGRAICVAAGNAGQSQPENERDFGFVMGRIHASGRIAATGLTADLEWIVVGNGIADVSENELEIWYEAQDRFDIEVRTPEGQWLRRVTPAQMMQNERLPNGTFISIYNDLYHRANGLNHIAVYLTPDLRPARGDEVNGVAAGTWLIRLVGTEVRDGRFHAWIERDDPFPHTPIGQKEAWSFPSFFGEKTHVDDTKINTLACGASTIGVANLDEERERANASSSQGPTREGRPKPEVGAPGTDILAANGFDDPQTPWIRMTGTSMASPYVTGVVAMMLGVNPELTAAQVAGILRRTAKPLPGATYDWRRDVGFGRVDPRAAVTQAASAGTMKKIEP